MPQVRPRRAGFASWLGRDHVFVIGEGGQSYVWEPGSGRVLWVAPMPWTGGVLEFTSHGAQAGSAFLAIDPDHPFGWEMHDLARDETARVAPTLDRVLTIPTRPRREVVVNDWSGRVLGHFGVTPEAVASFSPDGSAVLTCDGRGAELHDAATGAWLAGYRGDATRCVWSGEQGPIAIERADDLLLLDPRSLQPMGEPIPFGLGIVSSDAERIAVALGGAREGVSVFELATRREIFHRSMRQPSSVRLAADVVAYANETYSSESGGAFRIVAGSIEGQVLVEETESFSLGHLGPNGDLLVFSGDATGDGVWTVRGAADAPVARYDLPVALGLTVSTGGLIAEAGSHSWHVTTALEARPFGRCAERPVIVDSLFGPRVVGRRVVPWEDGWALVVGDCIRRDDGTARLIDGMHPFFFRDVLAGLETDAFGGERFVSIEQRQLVVRSLAGTSESVLALDPGEEPPCDAAMCRLPLDVSEDGERIVVVRGPLLRVYDADTGQVTGRTSVGARTALLSFVSPDVLLHVDTEDLASVFSVTPRGLTRLATFTAGAARLDRPALVTSSGILDDQGRTIVLRGFDGRRIAEREVSGHRDAIDVAGANVFMRRQEPSEVVVLRLSDLSDLGALPGYLLGTGAQDDDVFTCRDDRVSRSTREGDVWRTRPLDLPCGQVSAFGDRFVVLHDSSRPTLFLIAPDDSFLEVGAVAEGEDVSFASVDGAYRSGVRVMLRRPEFTSEGMIDVSVTGTVEDWMAGR